MTTSELLAELHRRGVEFHVVGDRLRYRPKEALTQDLVAAMVEQKAALLVHACIDQFFDWLRRVYPSGLLDRLRVGNPELRAKVQRAQESLDEAAWKTQEGTSNISAFRVIEIAGFLATMKPSSESEARKP